jgi:hypothetical protein
MELGFFGFIRSPRRNFFYSVSRHIILYLKIFVILNKNSTFSNDESILYPKLYLFLYYSGLNIIDWSAIYFLIFIFQNNII